MKRGEYDPTKPSLLGPQLRLERAKAHLQGLEAEGRAYFQRNPCEVASQPHREGEWSVIRIEKIREWPDPRWGLLASEVIHHLRSSLNNLVWQLVMLEGEREPGEHNQFPIYTCPPKPGSIANMLRGVGKSHRTFIEEVQPYQRGEPHGRLKVALDWLSWLSNIDKHRVLHATFGVRKRGAQAFGALADMPGEPIEAVFTHGTLYEGAELVRFRAPDTPDATVTVEGQTPLSIAFGDPSITFEALANIYGRVAEMVEHFAADFPEDSTDT